MKSVCQSIWLYLMRLLYDPTGGLVFALGVVVSLVFSAISFKSEKTLWKCALLFIVLTLLVGYGIHYSKKNYTYVPDIYFDNVSLEYAYSKLDNVNLVCPRNQQNFDNKAMEHLEKGNNLSDHNFVVTGSDPAPGEFVKQGSSVILSVTWADVLTAINITKEEHKDFDPMEFYGDPEHAVIYDYSIGSLWLRTLPVGLKAVINGTEEHGLEVYPPKTEKSIVRGCLVDYFTNEVIDEAVCYLGDEIFFPNIRNGTYYFTCSCDGYELAVSNSLLRVHRDASENPYEIRYGSYWEVGLEKEDSYSPQFKIRLQDKHGVALAGLAASMRVLRDDDLSPKAWRSFEYITDENGYLNNHDGWYLMSGGILEFQLCAGHTIEISVDDRVYVPVPQSDSSEVIITVE